MLVIFKINVTVKARKSGLFVIENIVYLRIFQGQNLKPIGGNYILGL